MLLRSFLVSRKRLERRGRPQREIKPRVIIIGDGETEEDYINRLKKIDYFKNVNLKFEKGDEDNFEIKLKEHLDNIENVFLILDIDNVKSGDRYQKLANLINNTNYNIFYNNRSFETWLLNHKINFSSSIIYSRDYNKHIKTHFAVESWATNKNKNNREKIMNQIDVEEVDLAKENIRNISSKSWNENPSSNMDKFIEKIETIK